jgi:hypothetical protein
MAMPSFPMLWPNDRTDCSYNNILSKHGSFLRMLRTLKYFKLRTFRLLDPAFVSYGQLKQKDILFSRETNHHAIICCTYKTRHYCAHPITFALAYSHSVLLFPSPSCSIANTSIPHHTSPSAPSINDDDSGYNSATESAMMVTSSSPTCGVIKMDDREIPELADFFKKTIVTEADR